MKQLTTILLSLGVLLFMSCDDTGPLDTQEYIVFGFFDAYCYGECVDFYKLTPDVLLKSNIDQYSHSGFYSFDDYYALSQDKFNLVQDLGDFFPAELWSETATHIGQADVSDVGSLYFEIKNETGHRYWVFENGDFDMPEVYKEFIAKINEKVILLRF